jgi:A/G-specific adenine glycosylase
VRSLKHGIAWWIERDGQVWLVRRPASGLLGGMAALPGTEWTETPPPPNRQLATVRHVFTHFSLDDLVNKYVKTGSVSYEFRNYVRDAFDLAIEVRGESPGEGWWHPIDRLADAGLPTLYRRAAESALAARADTRAAA